MTLLWAVRAAFSGTGDLVVTVVDASDHRPLQGVFVAAAGNGVETGIDGRATFVDLPAGDVRVSARAGGRFPVAGSARVRGSGAALSLEMVAAPPDPTWAHLTAPRWDAAELLASPRGPGDPAFVVEVRVDEDEIALRAAIGLTPQTAEIALDGVRGGSVRVDGRPAAPPLVVIPAESVGRPVVVEVEGRRWIEPLCDADPPPPISVTREGTVVLTDWLPKVTGGPTDVLVTFDVWEEATLLTTGVEIGRRKADDHRVRITVLATDPASFTAILSAGLVIDDHSLGGRPVRIASLQTAPDDASLLLSRLSEVAAELPPLVVTGRRCGPRAIALPGVLDAAVGASPEAIALALSGGSPPATEREARTAACGDGRLPDFGALNRDADLRVPTSGVTPYCLEYLAAWDPVRGSAASRLLTVPPPMRNNEERSMSDAFGAYARSAVQEALDHRGMPDERARIRAARIALLEDQSLLQGEWGGGADPGRDVAWCIRAGLCDAQGTIWIRDIVYDGSSGTWDVPD